MNKSLLTTLFYGIAVVVLNIVDSLTLPGFGVAALGVAGLQKE